MKRFFISLVVLAAMHTQTLAQPLEAAGFTLEQLLDSIEVEMERAHIPGLMLTIVSRDTVLYDGGLGTADLEAERHVDATTLFRLGSVSKSFAALCILKLESEGKFSLEDKLSDVAPEVEFTNQWEDAHPVRVVHLLEHSAGFDDMHFHAMYNHDDAEPSVLEMINRHSKSLTTRWQPGARMAYSNPGYLILTHIIEKYSGMSYHDYIRQTIFEPLGMTHSNFKSFPEDFSQYAQGYAWKDGAFEEMPFYAANAAAAGALNSCGADMAKFVQMLLNRGRVDTVQVFPRELIQKLETPTSTLAARQGLRTMYAKANVPVFFDRPVSFRGHGGGIDGFLSEYYYNRRGYGYAMSNNASGDMGDIRKLILDYLLQGLSLVKPKKEPIPESVVDTFSGYYDFKSPRNQLFFFADKIAQGVNVSFRGDTLLSNHLMKPADKYLHMGDRLFRQVDHSAPTLILGYNEDGEPYLNAGGYYEQNRAVPIRRAWFFTAMGLMIIFGFFGLIWLLIRLFGNRKHPGTQPVLWLWLSVAGIIVAAISFLSLAQDFPALGAMDARTSLVFVGTALFGVGAVLGLIQLLRNFTRIKSDFLKYYLLISSVAVLSLAVYFYQHGWIGLQLWSY